MIAQDIVAQKITKLPSLGLETMVMWGEPNEELKLLQIIVSLRELPVGNLLVEVRNSILSVVGKRQMTDGSNKNVLEARFELADDVNVLSAHKDGNLLLLNLKYDCPKLMQDRTIGIVEI